MSITISGITNTVTSSAATINIDKAVAVTGAISATGGINNTVIGASTPLAGSFTTVSASGGVNTSAASHVASYGVGVDGGLNTEFMRILNSAGVSYLQSSATGTGVSRNIAINVGTTIATVSSTGLAVTGAISATAGLTGVTVTADDFRVGGGTDQYITYDTGNTGTYVLNIRNGAGSVKAAVSNTGLAVTGAISATTLLDLSAATAGQIKFPATQNASSDANTLDDYEEGTWTPTAGAGLTVVGTFSSGGHYIKVGKVVHITGFLSSTTSVEFLAAVIIAGALPFAEPTANPYSPGIGINNAQTATASNMAYSTNVYSGGAMAATPTYHFSITYSV